MINELSRNYIRKTAANVSTILRNEAIYNGAFPMDADPADLLPRNGLKAVRLA